MSVIQKLFFTVNSIDHWLFLFTAYSPLVPTSFLLEFYQL